MPWMWPENIQNFYYLSLVKRIWITSFEQIIDFLNNIRSIFDNTLFLELIARK